MIEKIYKAFLESSGVCTDTRNIGASCFFICLKGDHFNGNDFALNALKQGAKFILVDEDRNWDSNQILIVDNCLETLQALAIYHRNTLSIPVIGLTGSNGKTTTKELFREVLSSTKKVKATIGNLNNHIGVPLSILSINKSDEIAIIEMGANAQKEIEFLSGISKPDIGYITNFGLAHLEGFGGPEGVIKGKSELYEYLLLDSKIALVNSDDPIQIDKSSGLTRILFGTSEKPPFQFSLADAKNTVSIRWNDTLVETQLTGAYNFNNIAAAVSLGVYFNIPPNEIIRAISNYAPSNHRSQWKQGLYNSLIVDCYNANPSSVELALDNLAVQTKPRAAILGDMFEMGEYAQVEHQKIIDHAIALGIEKLIFVGSHFLDCNFPPAITCIQTTQQAYDFLRNNPLKEHTILIKGSRGMTLEKLLELL